jgi:hypothetical protein
MKKLGLAVFAMMIALGFGVNDASAQMKSDNPMVGGAAMYKQRISSITRSIRMITRRSSPRSKPPVWSIP